MKAPQKNMEFVSSILNTARPVVGFENLCMDGLKNLETTAFPTLRSEYWRYTRISGLLKKEFAAKKTTGVSLSDTAIKLTENKTRIVFVNGYFDRDLSVIPSHSGITILSENRVTEKDVTNFHTSWQNELEAFTLLNQSSFTDGVFIQIDREQQDSPIFVIHVATGENVAATERNYIRVSSGASATVIHLYEGEGTSFSNHFNSVIVDENAKLNWVEYHQDAQEASTISTGIFTQKRDSALTIGAYVFGGKLVRKNLYITIAGQNCETTANGAYILGGKETADFRVILDHEAAHCNSNQMFKGVVSDKATGIFNGKIYVRKDAQLIHAFQNNRNILLSDDAQVYSRPQLEIYADDVKCSHGSTTGQLDDEALFYMMARGIRKQEAEKLLVTAFTSDAIENISYTPLLETVQNAIAQKTENL